MIVRNANSCYLVNRIDHGQGHVLMMAAFQFLADANCYVVHQRHDRYECQIVSGVMGYADK